MSDAVDCARYFIIGTGGAECRARRGAERASKLEDTIG
jgi:hypothetical protein